MTDTYKIAKTRKRLLESQNHRCATCTKSIEFDTSGCIVFNRLQPRTYNNSVALCLECSSRQGIYSSLMEYYNDMNRYSQKIKPEQKIYPDHPKIVITKLANLCLKNNIHFQYWVFNMENYKYCPPEFLDAVVEALFRRLQNKLSIDDALSKRRKMTVSEAQNHRCCYCGYRFTHEEPENSVRSWSWEHVVDRNDKERERTHEYDNLVIACHLCNSLRGKTHWSVEIFYDWIKNNLEFLYSSAENEWKNFADLVHITQIYAIDNGLNWGTERFSTQELWVPWRIRNLINAESPDIECPSSSIPGVDMEEPA
jgi:5-methylcytosine-specific restriction endonuclease McrA